MPPVTIQDGEIVTYDKATIALRRSIHFFSALQASDGHWPAEIAGPLFFLPPLVSMFQLFSLIALIDVFKSPEFNYEEKNIKLLGNIFGKIIYLKI